MNDFLISQTNTQWITQRMDEMITMLSSHYTMRKLDSGEFATINIGGTSLTVTQYDADTLGNLLLLDSKDSDTFQMLTMVITPYYKALPVLSVDVMFNKEKRAFILEFYDLVAEKDSHYYSYLKQFKEVISTYDSLTDMPVKSCWYDSLRTIHTAKSTDVDSDDMLSTLTSELLTRYLEMEANSPLLSSNAQHEKWKITKEYADHLVTKGGVSTDLFKSVLGAAKTKEFFHTVFFGLDRHA